MRALSPVLLLVVACGGYQPGSLTVASGGTVSTVGCLDVGVERVHDAEAVGPVAGITFANRCDTAVRVDLTRVRAVGELSDGRRLELAMFDPDGVIRPGLLEARRVAREHIEFQLAEEITAQPARLCLDLTELDTGADHGRPVVACVGQTAVAR